MMKNKLSILLTLMMVCCVIFGGCGSEGESTSKKDNSTAKSSSEVTSQKEEEKAASSSEKKKDDSSEVAELNLVGKWKQIDSESEENYQEAVIKDNTITVYWVTDRENKSLYWAGTYKAPQNADEPYSWDSSNDHDQTDKALLASEDDKKTFTYEKGQISYSMSAMGVTTTVHLEKK